MIFFLTLIGALLGYGIASSQHEQHTKAVRRINESCGDQKPPLPGDNRRSRS